MNGRWLVGIDIGGTFTDVVAPYPASGDTVIVDSCGRGGYGPPADEQ
ncbi:MAG: hypothetical protein QF574_05245 [Arenicellales bacterium]|jgi:hypothetical protein|nr:hypothetical protein [Arenicellales bacterium]|tara:strand:+ start:183 stop:323 length:141 start_codon:yes stop_codon:yes gene_type:complete